MDKSHLIIIYYWILLAKFSFGFLHLFTWGIFASIIFILHYNSSDSLIDGLGKYSFFFSFLQDTVQCRDYFFFRYLGEFSGVAIWIWILICGNRFNYKLKFPKRYKSMIDYLFLLSEFWQLSLKVSFCISSKL